MKRSIQATGLILLSVAAAMPAWGQGQSTPKYSAKVPPYITTPDRVETRVGTLRFFDGLPDPETVQKVYDNLDFVRGVEAFLSGIPAASLYAACEGLSQAGVKQNSGFGITEDLMDARSLFLTPNSTSVYVSMCVDLKDEPVVVEVPPGVLGPVDDAYFRFVTDIGLTGPDEGKGGKYLFVPPGYTGNVSYQGYFVVKPPTYRNLVFFRAFVENGDIAAAVRSVKAKARVYPLSAADNPAATTFVNTSGLQFNTIHANDFHFYEEINAVIQHEPANAFDPEIVGLFASIGIKKGQPFAPDERTKGVLTDAVAVADATARAIVFAPRDDRAKFYPDRQWGTAFIGGAYDFMNNGETRARCSTITPPALRPRWPFPSRAPAPPMRMLHATRRAAISMAAGLTRSRYRRRSQSANSGRSWSMTGKLARCSRPIKSLLVSTATRRTSKRTLMVR
jgi:hypothetical protein